MHADRRGVGPARGVIKSGAGSINGNLPAKNALKAQSQQDERPRQSRPLTRQCFCKSAVCPTQQHQCLEVAQGSVLFKGRFSTSISAWLIADDMRRARGRSLGDVDLPLTKNKEVVGMKRRLDT